MSAFTPRAVQPAPRSPLAGAGRGREEPGGAGRGPGRDSPRLRDYLLPSPGRPPLGLGLRPYWLPLILMDIRALGPPQADSTPEEPGERRSQDLRRVRTLRAISEKGRHKGPTLNPSGHTMPVEPEPDSGGRRENQEIASRLPPTCPRSPRYPCPESSDGTARLLKRAGHSARRAGGEERAGPGPRTRAPTLPRASPAAPRLRASG